MSHPSRSVILGAAVLAACLSGAGCASSDDSDDAGTKDSAPVSYVAEGLTCDFDRSALSAQDTNERVGGRVEKDFTVRFSRTTDVGIVALVTGDTKKAFDFLNKQYGVAIVARVERDKDPGRVASFAQVQKLVDAVCP